MKKNKFLVPLNRNWKKLLLTMKLCLLFLLISATSLLANSGYSQNTTLSIHLKNATLRDLISEVEKQSEFIFLFYDEVVDLDKQIDVQVENQTIDKILDKIFKSSELTYRIFDRQIGIGKRDPVTGAIELPATLEELMAADKKLTGVVKDNKGDPIPGATVIVKGTTIGTITDFDGKFTLNVPVDSKIISFSFIGYKPQEIPIGNKTTFTVTLEEQIVGLEEVVAVGYGTQKKASVVGAITTTTSKELQRSGGVTNLAQALTGNLPGITTIQTTGQPGKDDPKIYIRGQSTWNGGEPYILVDGVERRMNDLDISEVDNVSVLKDASATAVYGVKGANGVILITTKRGSKGKPVLTVSANSTIKMPARMVDKLDSYDMYRVKNESIEREVVLNEAEWGDYTPLAIVDRYRNQQNLKYPEAYPNIDWQKETIKKAVMNQRVNMRVAGGGDFAKYFTSLAYMHEGDLLKILDNGVGYKPGLGYDRFNFRTNLDLNLTKSTLLKINLAGVYGIIKNTYGYTDDEYQLMIAAYALPPNAFMPRYSDGRWGSSPNSSERMRNSASSAANSGIRQTRKTDLSTDLTLTQKLDFISNGLSISGNVSFDNHFESEGGIYHGGIGNFPTKWINPAIEDMGPNEDPNNYITLNPVKGVNQFDWVRNPWTINDESAVGAFYYNSSNPLSTLRRRLFYQGQANYARTFGRHDVTATGVFTREQLATGSEFQRYREDWIFRATYNYANRYFAEFNGAYNGSEKFGPRYRFGFFPSAAVGWTLSNEKFLKNIEWLDQLKLRYSYGLIGDDGISQRWLYDTQWSYGGTSPLAEYAGYGYGNKSPYAWYKESVIGNPGIHWEKATKSNLGLEMAVLNNMLSTNIEYFTEDRTDILLVGSSRTLPAYFGGTAPTANVGRVKKNGYEVELRFNKNLQNWHLWVNTSVTHAIDKILYKEEPELKDPHSLAQGFQIGQTKTTVRDGFYNTWDEVYASAPLAVNDNTKLPGYYNIIDFNGDGVIDDKDAAPYGYPTRPQNAFNFSFGTDYKGFSLMLQFYGVNNVTRYVTFWNFADNLDLAYAHTLDYWTKDNPNASSFLPRWKTSVGPIGDYFQFDGSYLRLKTAEVAYMFKGDRIKRYGLSSLKVFLNGNNLYFWSDLPDDREQGSDPFGAYPTSKRVNLGIDIKF
ncbi:MAG: TonB-dependent receptor [Bacteroidota bacterium]|nr:TonB-dependent receptor [Bacteroidota bacterium]